jgi:hypothetical protein
MKAYKETKTKYYKYQNADFVQPILTANGTPDGNSFAVNGRHYSSAAMYKAFDGNASSYWETYNYALVDTCYICNKIPINISEIKLTLSENKGWTQIVIAGSNDNVDYFEEQTIATVGSSNLDTFACSFEGYYKFYKITYTNRFTSAKGYYARIINMAITAQTRFIVDGTVDDYDYYKDVEVYQLPTKPSKIYYKHLASVTFNMCDVAGTFTSSGWQSSSKASNYIRGFANAYEKQNAKVSSAYNWAGGVPAGTYTYNITTTGQGNGYYNNPKVTVTYTDGETEVVFLDIFTGASYNKDFSFEAKKTMISIQIEGTLTSNGESYVEVATVLTSKTVSEKAIGSESDHDSYKDNFTYYGIGD